MNNYNGFVLRLPEVHVFVGESRVTTSLLDELFPSLLSTGHPHCRRAEWRSPTTPCGSYPRRCTLHSISCSCSLLPPLHHDYQTHPNLYTANGARTKRGHHWGANIRFVFFSLLRGGGREWLFSSWDTRQLLWVSKPGVCAETFILQSLKLLSVCIWVFAPLTVESRLLGITFTSRELHVAMDVDDG